MGHPALSVRILCPLSLPLQIQPSEHSASSQLLSRSGQHLLPSSSASSTTSSSSHLTAPDAASSYSLSTSSSENAYSFLDGFPSSRPSTARRTLRRLCNDSGIISDAVGEREKEKERSSRAKIELDEEIEGRNDKYGRNDRRKGNRRYPNTLSSSSSSYSSSTSSG
ncbi:uncharacterized protein MONOS_7307 [Monocercomonoides exilis]|uniref:uncharacterized protein n=1 Tax=Monocercomonoides exilis TaxID=2049356 RepID=UPI00355A581B|nr:hypothetical protein MONOS_7307 [Monocercomonoides exilis]|eukprot:MONOS_7307.1-p1 / transcript=MONOS_7307.1 / gene=MONOS_7307 / organism=Monocercomonoides_exilis_PA203 / gene_product=unspecified product / transcript_product=unspecified product / location=Mono_scaffold00247:35352-35849(-) / protein_length=166 / sequence_SO=supercontig / SO=protein_coding / is_pseudo=false